MSVYLRALGSRRGWSDFEGEMTSTEADWIALTGRYQMVSKALMQAISVSELDAALVREFPEKPE